MNLTYKEYQEFQKLKSLALSNQRDNGTARYNYYEWYEREESRPLRTNAGWPKGTKWVTVKDMKIERKNITWQEAVELRENAYYLHETLIDQVLV